MPFVVYKCKQFQAAKAKSSQWRIQAEGSCNSRLIHGILLFFRLFLFYFRRKIFFFFKIDILLFALQLNAKHVQYETALGEGTLQYATILLSCTNTTKLRTIKRTGICIITFLPRRMHDKALKNVEFKVQR